MALLHVPPADAASGDDRTEPAAALVDEIIDLTDRRRVLLHAVFGVAVDCDTADAVFEGGEPAITVEDDGIAVTDAGPRT